MTMIRDAHGRDLEVTRGVPPTDEKGQMRPFTVATPGTAELIRERAAGDQTKCAHAHQEAVYAELGLPSVMVRQGDEGEARVYSLTEDGRMMTALERPSRAFYERQQAAAEHQRAAAEADLATFEAEQAQLQAEYDAANTIAALKAFISAKKLERLEALNKAVPEVEQAIADATTARDWNEHAAAAVTALGEGVCVCRISAEVEKRRAADGR